NTCHERRGSTRLRADSTKRSDGVSCDGPSCRRRIASFVTQHENLHPFERSLRPNSTTSSNKRQATTYANDTANTTSSGGDAKRYPALPRKRLPHHTASPDGVCAPRARCGPVPPSTQNRGRSPRLPAERGVTRRSMLRHRVGEAHRASRRFRARRL